ncbi:hypothetical protein C9374_006728 [Naegleria lovaniensis]|uniref:Kinesin motor domain-containing protein n=1 Tax=Naegleria lovaniensis TaxID=51637 RepID=A0AA88GND8_NAELO|nr:uncharacterized protein C9374_006728 [Naegleria lovaniensis]KAG2379611.1 hypothetical protein C9374_006728 [Naegleria lovaniensis]
MNQNETLVNSNQQQAFNSNTSEVSSSQPTSPNNYNNNGNTLPQTPTSSDSSSVKVGVRVRPMLPKEKLEKSRECVTMDPVNSQIIVGRDRTFAFDYVFGQQSQQQQVYNVSVKNLVEGLFQGYNATVLAYGQTGSGKTYTMGTANSTNLLDEELGVIPRVIQNIFEIIKQRSDADFLVRVSFLEIYNETIKDLLSPSTSTKLIQIREDEKKGILLVGIKEESVQSYDDMIGCLETGSLYRTVGSTLMNEVSSRSHSIFTIILEQRLKTGNEGEATSGQSMTAKFHLVDLAGSERTKRTGAVGVRFKEAVQINCGLLALGNVISALGDEKKRAHTTHVPYRDSKLTRLLQDSLGGNSRTVMLACISPADSNFEETLNTLKYANRARNIKNKPVVNIDPHSMQIDQLRNEIHALKLALLQQKMSSEGVQYSDSLEELLKFEDNQRFLLEIQKKTPSSSNLLQLASVHDHKDETKLLRDQLSSSNSKITELSESIFKMEAERDMYLHKIQSFRQRVKEVLRVLFKVPWSTLDIPKEKITEIIKVLEDVANYDLNANAERKEKLQSLSPRLPNIEQVVAENHEIEEKNKVIDSLTKELKEAKDDLKRDEKIFTEKMREIKRLSKTNWVLKKNVQALKQDLDSEMKRVAQLEEYIQSLPEELGVTAVPPLPTTSAPKIPETNDVKQDVQTDGQEDGEIGKLEDEIKNLEKEKTLMYNQQSQIELEKSMIEKQMQEHQKMYLRKQRKLEQSLKDLTVMIKLKEELIKDLLKSEHESIVLKEQYEKKIIEMENSVVATQQELEKLMNALETADMERGKKEEEKKRIQLDYEDRLNKQNMQLSDLRKKATENERLMKLKYQSDRKVYDLQTEITKMKSQQEFLKGKIKEETEKQSQTYNSQLKQISALKKQGEASQKRIRELETENQRQKEILERKSEEVQKVNQQLRLNRYQLSRVSKSKSISADIDKQKEWLDKEIEKYMTKKEAIETLEKELARREAIIQEKEKMLSAKQDIEMRKMRKNQHMQESMVDIHNQLQEVEREIVEKETILKSKRTSNSNNCLKTEAKIINDLQLQIESLHQKREKMLRQREKLEQKAKDQIKKEEEELQEINERTEVLDAEIEFKNETIEQVQNRLRVEESDSSLSLSRFNDINSLAEAKVLLKQYFEKVIELKEDEKSKKQKLLEYDLSLKERDKMIENLQNHIRLTELVFERRQIKLQKESEQKITYLLKQIAQYNGDQSSTSGGSLSIDTEKIDKLIKYKDEQIQKLEKQLDKIKLRSEQVENNAAVRLSTNTKLSSELRSLKQLVSYKHSNVNY